MIVSFSEQGFEDYNYWVENDLSKIEKIKQLLRNIKNTPFKGLGKPEALKHDLKGYWSRRIDLEHRLVYKITEQIPNHNVTIVQCRYHY